MLLCRAVLCAQPPTCVLTCVSMYAVRESSLVPHTVLSSKIGTA